VHFTHQLLQEYFAARALRAAMECGRLRAVDLWHADRWWVPSGWEETAVLMTGLYDGDCTPALEWVAEANPEAAARCAQRSGAQVPNETLRTLRVRWIPRLTDLVRDPQPEARAAIGRAIGTLILDDLPLDDRKGVSVRIGRSSSARLPDIDWVAVPAGKFKFDVPPKTLALDAFRIARYPITNAQFQCFIDDRGYDTAVWWEGLADRPDPAMPRWPCANHPRETVSWFEAIAYCRWLDVRLRAPGELDNDEQIRLPTEYEWEKAARGTDQREYPWGKFKIGHANIDETWGDDGPHYLRGTSAVGIYPQGASPYGTMDMAGNVWEWCHNHFGDPRDKSLPGSRSRVLRGGSWYDGRPNARCAFRDDDDPAVRNNDIGFRVVCGAPIA
jgi:formylglycine-generating enzyme required for sulfatase activity